MQLVQFSRRIWEGTKYAHTEQYAARQQVSSRKTQKLRSLPRATAWGNDRDADSYHHHPINMLMFASVAMLPFDGTKIGIPLPYWTPISPWLFTLYTIINWRYLRDTARRFLPFFLFPLLLVLTSVYGWQSYGIHASATAKSFISILLGLACLASLDIAIRIKRVPVRTLLTTLFTAYVAAFLIGILQYIALERHLNWQPVLAYFGGCSV